MKHLRNMLDGMAIVFDSLSSGRVYVTNLDGFKKDSQVLALDVNVFSADLKKQSDLVYGAYTSGTGKEW